MSEEENNRVDRGNKKRKATGAKKERISRAKGKVWTFPKETIEEAIKVPKAIEEKNGGNPMPASELAKAVGYRLSSDWRFLDLLRAANLYGLVSGTGASATISLEKLGQDIVAPSSKEQRRQALLQAFRKVDDFRKVEEFYKGKKIPEDEYFLNTVARECNIDRDRVDTFKSVFLANLRFLQDFAARDTTSPDVPDSEERTTQVVGEAPPAIPKEPRVREFLDICFTMMPFGGWFDKYYQDIYTKAVKEAGFEPIRADEIFTTGSVVEQVWEKITKAKVLLADLTDKNPNVFYELGLAHAAGKPVVLTASQIDDVPFDLRHLRVITYDVREPDWASKLFKMVTDYLKSAKAEPERSIPQPFRMRKEED